MTEDTSTVLARLENGDIYRSRLEQAVALYPTATGRPVTNWPTPTARLGAARGPQPKRYFDPARSNDLDDAVAASGASGPLNPTWVEWLMGFPIGWTDLSASETP